MSDFVKASQQITHLAGGSFANREIMEPSPEDWTALLGRAAK